MSQDRSGQRLGVGEPAGAGGGAKLAGDGGPVEVFALVVDAPPGLVRGAFDDADEQQRRPAPRDVSADAVGEPVEHRP
jgi:hypothetical protein